MGADASAYSLMFDAMGPRRTWGARRCINVSMLRLRLLVALSMVVLSETAFGQSGEPVAVIDTTAGRITCTLLTRERPVTTARFIALATGSEPWTAPDGVIDMGGRFYDGTRIGPQAAGITGGARAAAGEKPASERFAAETSPALLFDRPGLLGMVASKGSAGPSRFVITDHANSEVDGAAVVFGRCDQASVKLVTELRRTLQSTDNHPAAPVVINHVAIVAAGKALPPVAAAVKVADIVPALEGAALAALGGPEPAGPTAVLETSAGKISCRLFEKESPIAVSTFVGLVNGTKEWTDPRDHVVQRNHRFYDGMVFNRVLPDFYIQFGDITGDISGNTDIGFRFKNENTPGLTFDRPGRLAFGNGGPGTNNSEMFFSLNPIHRLDGAFTIIGQCDGASVALLEKVSRVARDGANRPVVPVVIRRVEILR